MAEFDAATVTLTDMAWRIRNMYAPTGECAIFVGPPGMGKTGKTASLLRDMQDEDDDFGACYFNLSSAITPDVTGLPKITNGPLTNYGVPLIFQPNDTFGLRGAFPALNDPEADPRSPEFSWRALKPYSRGVVVLDEIGKIAEEAVFAKLAQILGDRSTGQWSLPEGWSVIGFSNREEDMSGDLAIPMHTGNRVSRYAVRTRLEDVIDHWIEIGMHPKFRAFAAANPSLVLSDSVPTNREQFSTARSYTKAWVLATRYCEAIGMPDANADDPTAPYEPTVFPVLGDVTDPSLAKAAAGFTTTIAARCGAPVALAFTDFLLHSNEQPTAQEVLDHPTKAKMPEHAGVLHATIEMLLSDIPFDKADRAFTYVRRFQNKAMRAVYTARFAKKFGSRALNLKGWQEMSAECGQAGRILTYS